MDLYVLDQIFAPIAVIDRYKSLIWTTKYCDCGDFELYMPADAGIMQYIREDYFIVREDDQTSVMIIESVVIESNVENGDYFIVSGRSAESLIGRRIIWSQTNLRATEPSQAVFRLITDNAISPTNQARVIPHITLGDPLQTENRLNIQFTGTNLLEAVKTICKEYGMGFRMELVEGDLVFTCYIGSNTLVTFSPEYDNLVGSDYSSDVTGLKNVALTAGEGEGTARKTAAVSSTSTEPTGIQRREIYVDARDISSDEGEISDSDYYAKLEQRGKGELSKQAAMVSFSCEVAPQMTYRYKVDYDLGDIVRIANSFGVSARSRITAVTESFSDEGYQVIPTFDDG